MAVTVDAAAVAAAVAAVTSNSVATMAPVRFNRVSACLLRQLPSVRKNCLATTVFFLMCEQTATDLQRL